MPEDFNEVQLTPEEADLSIFDARCVKYWDIKEKEKQRNKALALEMAAKPFTTRELQDFVLANNPWFKLDTQAMEVFKLLCLYFSGNPAFEEKGYSLNKGICLIGPVGVGKTELLNIFRKNKRQCFHPITVFEIETALQERGVEYITTFCEGVPGWSHSKNHFFQPKVGWAFDDIGRESVVFDFGNKSDAISKIIQTRYFKKVPNTLLHITTNKTPEELEKRYDEAVKSRLREMFNYIVYEGKDRRK